jgi:NIMA (never in mitosis gene a)-related kinase
MCIHDLICKQTKLLPEDKIFDIFTQICLAVKYIHDRKMIHRDLKTRNVFLCNGDIVKLGDFGVSQMLISTTAEVRSVMGTPYYLSPEICMGRAYAGPSDIWALGCILFEMCTLKVCFQGEDLREVLGNIIQARIPRVSSVYSRELRRLVSRLLQKDSRVRPTIKGALRPDSQFEKIL